MQHCIDRGIATLAVITASHDKQLQSYRYCAQVLLKLQDTHLLILSLHHTKEFSLEPERGTLNATPHN